jgi:sulfoxide reductase heme-binding subunit YedZ
MPGWTWLLEYRRPLGLFAFSYGTLHFAHYLALDKLWEWSEVWTDFTLRRFFIAGLLGWAAMIPLAATSFNKAIQWMGGKNWQRLHRLAYFSALAGVAHFYWQGKAAMLDPVIYAVIFFVLMGYRVWLWMQKRRNKAARLKARPA